MSVKKYKLNYLRILTAQRDENGDFVVFPDEILETIHDIRFEDGKLKFRLKVGVNKKDWIMSKGTSE